MHNKLWIIPTAIVSHSNDTSLQLHRHQFQWFPGLGADPCISQSEPAPVFITNAKSTQCKSLYGDVPEPQFIYLPKTSRSFRLEDNYHCSRRTMGLVTNVAVWHVSHAPGHAGVVSGAVSGRYGPGTCYLVNIRENASPSKYYWDPPPCSHAHKILTISRYFAKITIVKHFQSVDKIV